MAHPGRRAGAGSLPRRRGSPCGPARGAPILTAPEQPWEGAHCEARKLLLIQNWVLMGFAEIEQKSIVPIGMHAAVSAAAARRHSLGLNSAAAPGTRRPASRRPGRSGNPPPATPPPPPAPPARPPCPGRRTRGMAWERAAPGLLRWAGERRAGASALSIGPRR